MKSLYFKLNLGHLPVRRDGTHYGTIPHSYVNLPQGVSWGFPTVLYEKSLEGKFTQLKNVETRDHHAGTLIIGNINIKVLDKSETIRISLLKNFIIIQSQQCYYTSNNIRIK